VGGVNAEKEGRKKEGRDDELSLQWAAARISIYCRQS